MADAYVSSVCSLTDRDRTETLWSHSPEGSYDDAPDPVQYWGYDPRTIAVPDVPAEWPAAQNTMFYCVNPDDPASTDTDNSYGYPDKPRKTPPTSVAAGVAVYFYGGAFAADVSINTSAGTQANPIFIYGAGETVFQRFYCSAGVHTIVDGLTFTPDPAGLGNTFNAGRTYTTLRNCLFVGSYDDFFDQHIHFYGNDAGSATAYFYVYNNIAHDSGTLSAEKDIHWIKLTDHASYLWVINNDCTRFAGDSVQLGGVSGPITTDDPNTVWIFGNGFYSNAENGTDLKDTKDVMVGHNKFDGAGGYGSSNGSITSITGWATNAEYKNNRHSNARHAFSVAATPTNISAINESISATVETPFNINEAQTTWTETGTEYFADPGNGVLAEPFWNASSMGCAAYSPYGVTYVAIRSDRPWERDGTDNAAIKAGVGGAVTWAESAVYGSNPTVTPGVEGYVGWVQSFPDPVISATTVTIDGTSATLRCATDLPNSMVLEYGLTASYGDSITVQNVMYVTHQHTLTGLTEGETYHYRWTGTNAMGDQTVGADQIFVATDYGDDLALEFDIQPGNLNLTLVQQAINGFECYVDWGDGNTGGPFTVYNDAGFSHDYAAADVYVVRVSNIYFGPALRSTAAAPRLIRILSMGATGLANCYEAFRDCANLTHILGKLTCSGSLSLSRAFLGCTRLEVVDTSNWTGTDMVTSYAGICEGNTALTTMLTANLKTDNSVGFNSMFTGCALLEDLDPSSWLIPNITTAAEAFNLGAGKGMTQSVYEATLVAWQGQTHNNTVVAHFGLGSVYADPSAAATARAALVVDGWTITDGGAV